MLRFILGKGWPMVPLVDIRARGGNPRGGVMAFCRLKHSDNSETKDVNQYDRKNGPWRGDRWSDSKSERADAVLVRILLDDSKKAVTTSLGGDTESTKGTTWTELLTPAEGKSEQEHLKELSDKLMKKGLNMPASLLEVLNTKKHPLRQIGNVAAHTATAKEREEVQSEHQEVIEMLKKFLLDYEQKVAEEKSKGKRMGGRRKYWKGKTRK